MIEIVIAIIVISVLAAYISYILGFFSIIPASIMSIVMFALAIDIILFVIHRK